MQNQGMFRQGDIAIVVDDEVTLISATHRILFNTDKVEMIILADCKVVHREIWTDVPSGGHNFGQPIGVKARLKGKDPLRLLRAELITVVFICSRYGKRTVHSRDVYGFALVNNNYYPGSDIYSHCLQLEQACVDRYGSDKPLKVIFGFEPHAPRNFEVWIEGYSDHGITAGAKLMGNITANTLEEAVELLWERDSIKTPYEKNSDGTYRCWGCRLYDNEIDARKSYG